MEAFAPDRLRLFILPTERCNFRCVYCYEDFLIGRMSSEVVSGLKALISQRASTLSGLRLSWFGGEPTTAIDIVHEIMRHAIEAARAHKLQIDGDMTTNAFRLNREMLANLCNLSVREFQITLDGPEAIHNKTRVLANGQKTFHRIWANLLQAKASPLPFQMILRVHLTHDNHESMPQFVDQLRDTFLDDARFSITFKAVGHWGGPHDNTFAVLSNPRVEEIIQSLSYRLYGDRKDSLSTWNDEVCYAARPNNFVIRADGRVEKCTVALNKPGNLVGRLNPDGTLTFRDGVHQNWLYGWKAMDGDILSCPMWIAMKSYNSEYENPDWVRHTGLADPVSRN
jgi:uncharacterized protein